MKVLRGKCLVWIGGLSVILAALYMTEVSYVAFSFTSLREVKQKAREEYSGLGIPEIIRIDGAVAEDGSARVNVSDWKSCAIALEEKEIPVYASSEEKTQTGILKSDTIIQVLKDDGQYWLIRSGRLTGYVKSSDFLYGEEAKKIADIRCPAQVITDEPMLHVRKDPNHNSIILSYMNQRESYKVLGKRRGFYKIPLQENLAGYVENKKVKEVRTIHLGVEKAYIDNPQKAYQVEELSTEERNLLAAAIYCESGGEFFEGQLGVGSVILNRVKDSRFPNTIQEVLYQSGQFESVYTGWYDRVLAEPDSISASSYEAADCVLQGYNNIGECLYFDQGGYGVKIGSHFFH